MSIERHQHPRLERPEAEIAIGSLATIPPADIARSVVIAEDHHGNIRFASSLTNYETAQFLVEALTWLIAETGIPS